MILDKQTLLSNAQALTTTAVSENTYDLGVARDIGVGEDLEVFINVVEAFAGGTSVTFELIKSANANLSSPTVLVATPAILTAALTAGTQWLRVCVPADSTAPARYLGLRYTISGTYTAGKVTAGLVLGRDANTAYTSGLNVSGF